MLAVPGPVLPRLLVISRERSRYMLCSVKSSTPDSISHGQVCSTAPAQNWPSPWPWIRTLRSRCMMPSHWEEQAVQSCHSVNRQSMLGVHPTLSLQVLCSMDSPTAGTPQSLASTATPRTRQVSPPLHVVEHGSQSLHWSHWPLMQTFSWQRWVLHGSISSLALASQGLHPWRGALMMARARERCPPSQGALQVLHADHSFQRQSTHWHSCSWHGRASVRPWSQPRPASQGRSVKSRPRASMPPPQVALH
mmetsp:Transcript_42916/g.113643  ORF Transcript_42916/g.113643 Transcript_42916/m.113643 type:complete len:250 (-) Transcript_42916:2915-3664(-)